jgi:hypothetical protein
MTSDPEQPVLVEGGWQQPTAGETEKHSLIRHLQVCSQYSSTHFGTYSDYFHNLTESSIVFAVFHKTCIKSSAISLSEFSVADKHLPVTCSCQSTSSIKLSVFSKM